MVSKQNAHSSEGSQPGSDGKHPYCPVGEMGPSLNWLHRARNFAVEFSVQRLLL